MKRALPILIICVVLFGALFSVWYFKQSTGQPQRLTTGATNRTSEAKLGAEPPHTLGDTNAAVMVEEFADFECPPCASLQPVLKAMKQEFGPRLVIVFRQFPIAARHKHALSAARAAEAAGAQGKFWEMHDLLYENQKTWHEATDVGPIFEEYAGRIGLQVDRFKADLADEALQRRIILDRERGAWIGVNSTPTVFLNGREIPIDSLEANRLRELIRSQINAGGGND